MDVTKIINNDRQLQALTSLNPSEFQELLPIFTHRFEQKYKHFGMTGKRRKKPLSVRAITSPTKTLPGTIDKLLFILYHFKIDAIQFAEAAFFELSQSQTSRWIKYLQPVLQQTIVDLHLHPARNLDELIRLFRNRQRSASVVDKPAARTLHADATEREISRNVDYEAQRYDYSGKQGKHCVKNTVINDEFQFIHFLGYTHRGAIHDKKLLEEELPHLNYGVFAELWFTKDSGYQGYLPSGVHCMQPYKKRRGMLRTAMQKEFNTWLASIRAVSENTIGSLKKLRGLKHKRRRFRLKQTDLSALIAAGLHNLRVSRRQTTYESGLARVRANL